LLEARLANEGLRTPGATQCVPEPAAIDTTPLDCSAITVEYFPSLRSPYTAIGHRRVLDLFGRSGVNVLLRPVMPMLMRGVTAPRAKQRYIITDAGREGRAHGAPLGRIVDPFGEPVKQAFALFPAALALDRGMEFVTAYLQAAWFDGVDITTTGGLEAVAAQAGIDWNDLETASRDTDWQTLLDENLRDMLAAGLWGVPSFRVSGGSSDAPFAAWGQDRIWRIENEIASRV
jgi:2-hydroxychromene-2-carboxylate isomerase